MKYFLLSIFILHKPYTYIIFAFSNRCISVVYYLLVRLSSLLVRLLSLLPNQELRGLSPNYRGERWAYVHRIRGAANHPIIYLRPTFGLPHEACNSVYLRILPSEAPTSKKCEEKMHIEASTTIFFRSFREENSHYVRHISIVSSCISHVLHIGLISPGKPDNCMCAKSLVIFTRCIWGIYRDNCLS